MRDVDAERAAGDLVLAQRLPGPAERQPAQAQRDPVGQQREAEDDVIEEDRRAGSGSAARCPKKPAKRARPARHAELQAEQRRARDAGDAVRAVGQRHPVGDDDADDLAERQGHDRQVVAAQPQHGEAEHHAPERGQQPGDRQAGPETEAEGGREDRVGIGADGVERDVAEVEQPGEPDHDVQPPAEHDVGQHQRCRGRDSSAAPLNGSSDRREPAARARRICRRASSASAKRAVGAARPRRGSGPRQASSSSRPTNTAATAIATASGRDVRNRPRVAGVGLQPDHRREQAERDERRRGTRRAAARRFHTFSTSARPRMPVGRKISAMTRMENAATSLYWTLK